MGMHLLLVAATEGETALLREALPWQQLAPDHHRCRWRGYRLDLLHTGIGMVNTAWSLARWTGQHPGFERAINLGIAGSYDRELALGSVVECETDCFSELGAESPGGFLDLRDLGFVLHQPSQGGAAWSNTLRNPAVWARGLPLVQGITVNTVHGTQPGIAQALARWQPQVESMEGAAFFYAMLRLGKPFWAFRSLSNYVEPRNRAGWQIGLALRQLTDFVLRELEAGRF